MHHFTFLILLLVSTSLVAQSTLESIPNQKLINGSYVCNPAVVVGEVDDQVVAGLVVVGEPN